MIMMAAAGSLKEFYYRLVRAPARFLLTNYMIKNVQEEKA